MEVEPWSRLARLVDDEPVVGWAFELGSGDVPVIVLTVRSDRIHHRSTILAGIAHGLPIHRIERHLTQVLRHEVVKTFWVRSCRKSIARERYGNLNLLDLPVRSVPGLESSALPSQQHLQQGLPPLNLPWWTDAVT